MPAPSFAKEAAILQQKRVVRANDSTRVNNKETNHVIQMAIDYNKNPGSLAHCMCVVSVCV